MASRFSCYAFSSFSKYKCTLDKLKGFQSKQHLLNYLYWKYSLNNKLGVAIFILNLSVTYIQQISANYLYIKSFFFCQNHPYYTRYHIGLHYMFHLECLSSENFIYLHKLCNIRSLSCKTSKSSHDIRPLKFCYTN